MVGYVYKEESFDNINNITILSMFDTILNMGYEGDPPPPLYRLEG